MIEKILEEYGEVSFGDTRILKEEKNGGYEIQFWNPALGGFWKKLDHVGTIQELMAYLEDMLTVTPMEVPVGKDVYEIAQERDMSIPAAAELAKTMRFAGYNEWGQEIFVDK